MVRHDVSKGVSAARNRGVAEAQGAWIAFVDDDDLWAPQRLSRQLRAVQETGRDWAYTGSVNITLSNRAIGGAPPLPPEIVARGLRRANLVPGGCSGVLVRTDFLPGGEAFDGSYFHFADWDLWIRLATRGMPAWVPEPLVGYRVHAGNASHDTEGMIAELDIIEARYGGPVDRVRFYRHVARVSLRGGRRRQALGYYVRAAALGEGRYFPSGFLHDVGDLADGVIQGLGRRLGWSVPGLISRSRHNPHRGWLEQASRWLDQVPRTSD
jgi:glycosyltransferase involved in cell wall biosynthesis